jgi:hypothetical protein
MKICPNLLPYPEEFPKEDNKTQETEQENDDLELRELILNALNNLKSHLKTLEIIVNISNNYTGYSIFTGKPEAFESGFEFQDIEGYKVLFEWLRNPNGYVYFDRRDLFIHFLDGTVILGTTDDL